MYEAEIAQLSPRQLEILIYLSKGMHNHEIATMLHRSEATICDHVKDIFRILDVHTRVEAAVMACKAGLL